MGYFVDGRASLVIGTHTHVPTADWKILSGGTAYMTDVGMCGDYDSVIGMEKDEPLRRSTTKIPSGRLEPALGPGTLSGLARRDRRSDRACAAASRRFAWARACRRRSRISEPRRERRTSSRPSRPLLLRRDPLHRKRRAVPGELVPLQGLPPPDRRAGGRVGGLQDRSDRLRGEPEAAPLLGARDPLVLRRLRHPDQLRARGAYQDEIYIHAGLFDEADRLIPDRQAYVTSKLFWMHLEDRLDTFEETTREPPAD